MNSKGFATIAILALLPLLLAIVAVVAGGLFALRVDGESRHVCRTKILQEQRNVADVLSKLMAMNPGAQTLRLRRTQAEHDVLTAPPPAKPLAIAILQEVIAEQMVYAARQKALIVQGRQRSMTTPSQTREQVRRVLFAARVLHGETGVDLNFSSQVRTPWFELIAKPRNSPTPDYEPPSDFAERQVMRVEWSARIPALLPAWLTPLANASELKLQASCSGTIEKGNGKWIALLKMDKL